MVTELLGVYDAEGSLRGELRYLIGKWRGTAHCELCDITHGRLREKQEFRALRERLPVPLTLVHLDERATDVATASEAAVPCVLARVDGKLHIVMEREALRACGGDVHRFGATLRDALDARGLRFPT